MKPGAEAFPRDLKAPRRTGSFLLPSVSVLLSLVLLDLFFQASSLLAISSVQSSIATSASLDFFLSPLPLPLPRLKGSLRRELLSSQDPAFSKCARASDLSPVPRNLLCLLQEAGLRPLTPEKRAALQAPCSATWRASVLSYLGATDTQELCQKLGDLEASLGLVTLKESHPQGEGGGEDSQARKPAAHVRGSPLPEPRNASLQSSGGLWGDCWPGGIPMSPGIQVRSLHGAKFLVFAFSHEQLSKARMHLAQAARLARLSGRILVLPYASSSRLTLGIPQGAPRQGPGGTLLPICRYLDLSNLANNRVSVDTGRGWGLRRQGILGGAQWMSADVFLLLQGLYIQRRPRVSYLCLTSAANRPCFTYQDAETSQGHILAASHGLLPAWRDTFSLSLPFNPQLNAEEAVHTLNTNMSSADVVFLMKNTPSMLNFSDLPSNLGMMDSGPRGADLLADALLPYSPWLVERAHRLVARIGRPFIALHLRSEYIILNHGEQSPAEAVRQMRYCTQAAAGLGNRVLKESKTRKVFIAADVPSGGRIGQKSSSWKRCVKKFGANMTVELASEALQQLRSAIPHSVMLEELDPGLADLDPGEVSVIDKLIASEADTFLAGTPWCGGEHSFEADIRRIRESKRKPAPVRWGPL